MLLQAKAAAGDFDIWFAVLQGAEFVAGALNMMLLGRNMRDGIAKEPRATRYAAEAVTRAGMAPKFKIIRGGTDGAMLTEKGLPTPNLSTGEHNPHSPLEWTCLEEMEAAVRVVVELVQVWAGR